MKWATAFNRTLEPSLPFPPDTFETERDDEIAQWHKHGYVEQVKTRR